jgi:hypothetical protein
MTKLDIPNTNTGDRGRNRGDIGGRGRNRGDIGGREDRKVTKSCIPVFEQVVHCFELP